MTTNREKESIEAATFRRLVYHLQSNTDLQNIDLMNLAGFCRNCLSKWMVEEARKKGLGKSSLVRMITLKAIADEL